MSQESYNPSAASSHAATVLLRNYQLRETGKIQATAHNVAVIVDVCTQTFRLELGLTALVKAGPWVAHPRTLENHLDEIRAAVLSLEQVRSRMPRFEGQPETQGDVLHDYGYTASAPAVYASRSLLRNFMFSSIQRLPATEKNIAIIVDVCTQVFRIEKEVDKIASSAMWLEKRQLVERLDQLRVALRAIELVRNRMPRFAPETRVVVREREADEPKFTRQQVSEAQTLSRLVAAAPTVEEQQRLLMRAGAVSTQ